MGIARTKHNRENPFVQLNKEALWDSNLSLQAVGLWARCLSRPDDWQWNLTELAKSCKINIETLRKYVSQLIEAGYAIGVQARKYSKSKRKLFDGYNYMFFEFPLTPEEKERYTEELKEIVTNTGFSSTEPPTTEKPQLLISNVLETKGSKEKACSPTPKGEKNASAFFSKDSKKKGMLSESSVEFQVIHSKIIPESDWESVIKLYEANKKKFDSKRNPVGYLVDQWKRGKHKAQAVQDENKVLAAKAYDILKDELREKGIRFEGKGSKLEISGGGGVACEIYYSDCSFEEQMVNCLRKKGILT